jgi:hypothetical protein
MANLKQDLLNNLQNEKYYDELELARLAQDPNMNYKEKVDDMSVVLKNIADVDLATQLIGKYFPEQQPAPAPEQPAPEQPSPEQPQAHPGQSHGE